jgi:hypothetical protein
MSVEVYLSIITDWSSGMWCYIISQSKRWGILETLTVFPRFPPENVYEQEPDFLFHLEGMLGTGFSRRENESLENQERKKRQRERLLKIFRKPG